MTLPPDARLGDTIRKLIEQRLGSFWTAVLGRVEEIDQEKCRAKVKPLLKLPTEPGKYAAPGLIYDVPIDIARAGPFYVRRPYEVGDIVLLIVSSRSLERTIHDHEPRETGFAHKNALEDVILLGGFRADTDPLYPKRWKNDLLIQNVKTGDTIVCKADGGMDVMLKGREAGSGYSLKVDAMGSVRVRSSRGRLELEAARKILLGLPAKYRVCLYPLVEWCASHVHTGVVSGEEVSGPPPGPPPDEAASRLVMAQYEIPGSLPFPEIETLADLIDFPDIAAINGLVSWVVAIGTSLGLNPGQILELAWKVISAVGEAIAAGVAGFVEMMAEYAEWIVEEIAPVLIEALVEAIQENWLELLALALTNPAAAVALLVKHVATNFFGDVADKAIAEFFDRMAGWLVDVGLEAIAQYLAEIDGLGDIQEFLEGLRTTVTAVASGEVTFERVISEVMKWAVAQYGDAGAEAVVTTLVGAVLNWVKGKLEEQPLAGEVA